MKSLSSMIRRHPRVGLRTRTGREPNMNIQRLREARHGYLKMAVALLPFALLIGCNSAPTGTAPGLAGGQALTPGITNYPMAYVKQPVLAKNTNKKNQAATPTDIDVRDLITSITGSD